MSEAIQFREIKLEGGWLMVKPERQELGKAMALVRRHKQRLYDLDIKEHREKRSLDANAYAWVLIHKLAEAMRISPEEVYLQAILDIGGHPNLCTGEGCGAFQKELAEQWPWVAGEGFGAKPGGGVQKPDGVPRLQHL